MKKNFAKKVTMLLGTLLVVMTVMIVNGSKNEAKAFDFFDSDRISIKKCAITLVEDKIPWTGEEIEPKVIVNYKGTELEEGVDYVLTYSNNVDAGKTATVKVTGKGNYKSSQKITFTIKGIDIEKDCIVSITQNEVEVYYNNRLLIEDKEYWVNDGLRQEMLIESVSVGNQFFNTYQVTQYIVVSGKGQFTGAVSEKIVTTERRMEEKRR